MDIEAALLAELPPSSWRTAHRRHDILAEHMAARDDGVAATRSTSARLGIAPSSLDRLLRAHRLLAEGGCVATNRKGRIRRLDPEVARVVSGVRAEYGGRVPLRAACLETIARCAAAGLIPPSLPTLTRHLSGLDAPDLAAVLGRRFDLIADSCATNIDVEHGGGARIAHLSVVLAASDGALLAWSLTAGAPSARTVAQLLDFGALDDEAVLAATDALPNPQGAAGLGPVVDQIAGRGLRPGSAILAAIGRKIGGVRFLPKAGERGQAPTAVPLPLATRVMSRLLRPDLVDAEPHPPIASIASNRLS